MTKTIPYGSGLNPCYLFESGIQTEDSTHRVHVDLPNRKLYVFETREGVKKLPEPIKPVEKRDWETFLGYELKSYGRFKINKIATSRGLRVKWHDISGCREFDIPPSIEISDEINGENLDTSQKGDMAIAIAQKMFALGLVTITIAIDLVQTTYDQLKGIDAQSRPIKIQIKCDRWCNLHGLFLQTHERNFEHKF